MPYRAPAPCTVPGCGEPAPGGGRCAEHAQQAAARRRLDPAQQGYRTAGHRAFRAAVLDRDPVCRCTDAGCTGHPGRPCVQPSTVADHWPVTRRALVRQGLDPDRPEHGRGLCQPCHNRYTARDPVTRGGGTR
ncbi:holin [Amycolatopsis thailandensis]|uniref:Holin n=1 Tax=Amycolatopsis thailandensis TaxID=589330 RepID=A0A229S499_9PSEU|nr:holin [Amycolatopsis thailandensis]